MCLINWRQDLAFLTSGTPEDIGTRVGQCGVTKGQCGVTNQGLLCLIDGHVEIRQLNE